jgi:hypothetical protein
VSIQCAARSGAAQALGPHASPRGAGAGAAEDGKGGQAGEVRLAALAALASLAKDNAVAPVLVQSGAVAGAVSALRTGTREERGAALSLLQRASTAPRVQHALLEAGVVAALEPLVQQGGGPARPCAPGTAAAREGGNGSKGDRGQALLAALTLAPLLHPTSAAAPARDFSPGLWAELAAALGEALGARGGRPAGGADEERVSLYELVFALRHAAHHRPARAALARAGVVPLLSRAAAAPAGGGAREAERDDVAEAGDDAAVAALAAQALLDLTSESDRDRARTVAAQLAALRGEEWHGHLALLASRARPASPDELDILLVM